MHILENPTLQENVGSTEAHIMFLIFAQKVVQWYSLEPPQRGFFFFNDHHNLCYEQNLGKNRQLPIKKCHF